MRRADRLFQIIQYLRSRRLTTAAWLAERLEVSPRTIYRDVQDLILSGVDIDGEAGAGYRLRGGYDLPPLMFTAEELSALALGARIVNSWADPELAKAANQALSKVESVLPESLKSGFQQTALFSPMVRLSPEVATVMQQLRGAIKNSKKVEFHYTRADGESSVRIIWPLGLFYWGSTWTLGAWCELRGAFRNFRLDRIGRFYVSDEIYQEIPGQALADFIEEAKREAQKECPQLND